MDGYHQVLQPGVRLESLTYDEFDILAGGGKISPEDAWKLRSIESRRLSHVPTTAGFACRPTCCVHANIVNPSNFRRFDISAFSPDELLQT